MVELVGLEPTTKVLWNMVGVRPTPLVGHPSRTPGVLLFCVIILAFLAGRPTSADPSLASVSAETTFDWVRHFRIFSGRKFPFPGNRETGCGDSGPRMRCCRFCLAGQVRSARTLQSVPMGLICGKSEGLVLASPFDGHPMRTRNW